MRHNSLRRISGMYFHYLHSMKRNPARLIEILVWPAFEVLLFSLLAGSNRDGLSEVSQLTLSLLTGVVYWNSTARIIQEAVAQYIDDFTSKNIQHIMLAPVSAAEITVSITAASITKVCISLCVLSGIIYLTLPTFFSTVYWGSVWYVMQLELMGIAFSLFGISLVNVFGERASFSGWMMSTVLQLVSLPFYPRNALPELLQALSYAIPASFIFEDIRNHAASDVVMTTSQVIALGESVIYLIVGALFVSWSLRIARRTGIFSKL